MVETVVLGDRSLLINANADKKQGCYLEVLEQMNNQLTAMLSHHCRVLVLRLDFHLHDYTDNNTDISRFMRKIKKRLMQRYDMLRVGHVWVREIEKAKAQHYHVALLLDASTIQHPAKVIQLCEKVWQDWDHPKPITPKNCYYDVRRGDDTAYKKAFYRLSYLAKTRGKGYKAKAANDYSTSRITCKQQGDIRHGAI